MDFKLNIYEKGFLNLGNPFSFKDKDKILFKNKNLLWICEKR